MDQYWLPLGHHWNLHIEHVGGVLNAGAFTGGGNKMCWHQTVSPWEAVDSMTQSVIGNRVAPHFVIGGRKGLIHPVVRQLIPLNRAGRALGNDGADGYQTNRADAIQVEICWEAAFTDFDHYQALANLFVLTDHRFHIPNTAEGRDFSEPRRLSDAAWVKASGHVGHMHAPDNDHTDPIRFAEGKLIALIDKCPEGGYTL